MTQEATTRGAWVFLSHSHEDPDKVRRLRNALEERGHNPLLFFLKCLGDDSEIDDLIRREIEARTHFILCDSPNARNSRWVRAETEIIRSLPEKEYEVIDLDAAWEEQLQLVRRVAKRATVSISHSQADSAVAQAIARALREQDYAVFLDVLSVSPTGEWGLERGQPLQEALESGWVFILLSPDSVQSEMLVKKEIYAALQLSTRHNNVIPILVRDREVTLSELHSWPLDAGLPSGLTRDDIQMTDIAQGSLDEAISRLVRSLKTRNMA